MDNLKDKILTALAQDMDGVFTLADLKVALNENSEITLFRSLRRLLDCGELIKVKRGIYAVPDASLQVISSRIEPRSYISTDTILASKGNIGSVPVTRVQAVKTGRPRKYKCSIGVIEHLSISSNLFFGYTSEAGMFRATPEKAFIDVCYYCYKGKRFPFDPYTDMNINELDMNIISEYLKKYDRRFVTFYNRIWGAKS